MATAGSDANDQVGAGGRDRDDPLGVRPGRPERAPSSQTAATIRPFSTGRRRCSSSSGRATSACASWGLRTFPRPARPMLVGNHSGGIPYDGALLLHGIHRDHPSHRRVRPLVANFAFPARAGWRTSSRASAASGPRAETALPLLAAGELVAVFPEGLKGVGKLYRERYRMARFGRGGFVRLAGEAQVPLLPVAIVGAEEIHPRHREDYPACRAAGPALHPNNPNVSMAWAAGPAAGADQMDDPDRLPHPAAGGRRQRGTVRVGRGGPDGDRWDDRRLAGPAAVNPFRLTGAAKRLASRTLYSCGTIQFRYKLEA